MHVRAALGQSDRGDARSPRPQTQVIAEDDRVDSISLWDGTISQSGSAVDFTSVDFFSIDDGLAAERWDSVDYVRRYQSFGLLPAGPF